MSSARQAGVYGSTLYLAMTRLSSIVILASLLTHCTARLPVPGEPVSADVDQRWERRQQDQVQVAPPLTAEQQAAFDAGYAVGYRDARHGKPADADGHDDYRDTPLRSYFFDGYEAAIHQESGTKNQQSR